MVQSLKKEKKQRQQQTNPKQKSDLKAICYQEKMIIIGEKSIFPIGFNVYLTDNFITGQWQQV